MNFALSNSTLINTWQHIKLQHISAVCGLAIATIAAIVIVAAFGDTASPGEGVRTRSSLASPGSPMSTASRDVEMKTVYIVKTAQQGDSILQEQLSLALAGLLDISAVPQVIVDGTLEMDAFAEMSQLRAELASSGEAYGIQVVDLRSR